MMRMRVNKDLAVKVDIDKFHDIFKKRGLTMKEASLTCGLPPSYFSNHTTKNGALAKSAVILLEKVYNIKPEEYAVFESEPEVEEKNEQIVIQKSAEIDYKRLYHTIYKATYDSTMKAHEDWQDRKWKEQLEKRAEPKAQPIPIKREIASNNS